MLQKVNIYRYQLHHNRRGWKTLFYLFANAFLGSLFLFLSFLLLLNLAQRYFRIPEKSRVYKLTSMGPMSSLACRSGPWQESGLLNGSRLKINRRARCLYKSVGSGKSRWKSYLVSRITWISWHESMGLAMYSPISWKWLFAPLRWDRWKIAILKSSKVTIKMNFRFSPLH